MYMWMNINSKLGNMGLFILPASLPVCIDMQKRGGVCG